MQPGTTTPSTIMLRSQFSTLEEALASGEVKPGHLIMTDSNSKVKKHNVAGNPAERMFATEDGLQGKDIASGVYAIGDLVTWRIFLPGDLVLARLAAACPAVVVGAFMDSAGDGTLTPITSDGSKTLYVSTAASAAISNLNTITAFDKSFTVAANFLQVGDVIKITAQGIATATNSTDTLTITLKIGSTTIVATAALDVADNDTFQIEATLVIRTIGASGTFVATGYTQIGPPATAEQISFFKASTAINTTATQAITVSATWSVASASNSVRLDVLTIELIRNSGSRNSVCVATEAVDNSAGGSEVFCRMRVI